MNFTALNLLDITLLYFTTIRIDLLILLNLINLLLQTLKIMYSDFLRVIYILHLLTFTEVEYTLLVLALITLLGV